MLIFQLRLVEFHAAVDASAAIRLLLYNLFSKIVEHAVQHLGTKHRI